MAIIYRNLLIFTLNFQQMVRFIMCAISKTESIPIRTLKSNVRLIKHNIFGQDCYHVFHIIIILCGKILPAVKNHPNTLQFHGRFQHSSFMVTSVDNEKSFSFTFCCCCCCFKSSLTIRCCTNIFAFCFNFHIAAIR